MKLGKSLQDYERWLADQIEIVPDDLARKHEQMGASPFLFLRAAYPRWLQRVAEVAPELDAPQLASVGDLHVRNFGTWRDAEGRLVWGIDDFDQSEQLPYTYDLARLAVSAVLALDEGKSPTAPDDACRAILAGYARALADGGGPFVLAERKARLARLVTAALPDAAAWWQQLQADLLEPAPKLERLGRKARTTLEAVLPGPGWAFDVRRRVAGVGSLGRRRLVLLGDHDGALAARELKQLAPPAGAWLGRPASARVSMPHALRSADPFLAVGEGWLVRRLAPEYVKLDLSAQRGRTDARHLLQWMGAETANVHLAAGDGAAASVRADLAGRPRSWLPQAADRLVRATLRDWHDWRRG